MRDEKKLIEKIYHEVGKKIVQENQAQQKKMNENMTEILDNFKNQTEKAFQEFLDDKWETFTKTHKNIIPKEK